MGDYKTYPKAKLAKNYQIHVLDDISVQISSARISNGILLVFRLWMKIGVQSWKEFSEIRVELIFNSVNHITHIMTLDIYSQSKIEKQTQILPKWERK